MIAGRTASDMPGLDIAEQRSWQNFLDSALRMYATLNRSLVDAHHLTLNDVRLLDILDKSATGVGAHGGPRRRADVAAEPGDPADPPVGTAGPGASRRQPRRRPRRAGHHHRRGHATAVAEAMVTYGEGVRAHFLGRLSRPQIAAMGENCRRISVALKARSAREARPRLRVCSSPSAYPVLLSAVAWQSGLMHSP